MVSRFLRADSLNMSWRQERSGYSCVPEFHLSTSKTDSSLDLVASSPNTPSTTWDRTDDKMNAHRRSLTCVILRSMTHDGGPSRKKGEERDHNTIFREGTKKNQIFFLYWRFGWRDLNISEYHLHSVSQKLQTRPLSFLQYSPSTHVGHFIISSILLAWP